MGYGLNKSGENPQGHILYKPTLTQNIKFEGEGHNLSLSNTEKAQDQNHSEIHDVQTKLNYKRADVNKNKSRQPFSLSLSLSNFPVFGIKFDAYTFFI